MTMPARRRNLTGRLAAGALALGIVAAVGPALADAPSDPRIEALATACLPHRQDYAALTRHVAEPGWQTATANAHPELDALLAKSREVFADLDEDMTATLAVFGKDVGGRQLYLVATFLTSEAIDLVGCTVYDLDADAAIDPAPLTALFGQPPTNSIDDPKLIVADGWEQPKAFPGTWDAYSAYIPEGSFAAGQTGFTGVYLKITAVSPKNRNASPGDDG